MTASAEPLALARIVVTTTCASEPMLFDKAMELRVASYLRLVASTQGPGGRDRNAVVWIEVTGRSEVVAQFLSFARPWCREPPENDPTARLFNDA